jgi:hypothetical protein
MERLLDLLREFDGVEHAELDRRLVTGQELDAECTTALEKRLVLGDKIQKLLGEKSEDFEKRYDTVTREHPAFPWPAEVVARQLGTVAASEPGLATEAFAVDGCGCAHAGKERIAPCDAHREQQA